MSAMVASLSFVAAVIALAGLFIHWLEKGGY